MQINILHTPQHTCIFNRDADRTGPDMASGPVHKKSGPVRGLDRSGPPTDRPVRSGPPTDRPVRSGPEVTSSHRYTTIFCKY